MTEKETADNQAPETPPEAAADETPTSPPNNGDATAASDEAAEAATDSVDELCTRLESARMEAKDVYDRLLRVSAEFDNYKKRTSREMESFRKYANENLVADLLPVVDNLERAIESTEGQSEAESGILEGVRMTRREILKVLEKYGVSPIESVGQPFNPEYHEAVAQEPSADHPENTVLREFHKGYLLHDRLVRPAMVVVSKASSENG